MPQEFSEIKITETEDGFQVTIKGEKFKELFSCCCLPVLVARSGKATVCCSPTTEGRPSDEEKK